MMRGKHSRGRGHTYRQAVSSTYAYCDSIAFHQCYCIIVSNTHRQRVLFTAALRGWGCILGFTAATVSHIHLNCSPFARLVLMLCTLQGSSIIAFSNSKHGLLSLSEAVELHTVDCIGEVTVPQAYKIAAVAMTTKLHVSHNICVLLHLASIRFFACVWRTLIGPNYGSP